MGLPELLKFSQNHKGIFERFTVLFCEANVKSLEHEPVIDELFEYSKRSSGSN
jgi:hypothetical protein